MHFSYFVEFMGTEYFDMFLGVCVVGHESGVDQIGEHVEKMERRLQGTRPSRKGSWKTRSKGQ